RKLDRRAQDHGDALATRTSHLPRCKVPGEIILCEQRTNLGPGARDNVHALCRPVDDPWTGHVSQVDIELQQARGFLQLLGQPFYRFMLRLIGWTDHDLPDDFAIQIHGKMLFNPTATSIFDLRTATRYAPPAYPTDHQEAPYVTSVSDRR